MMNEKNATFWKLLGGGGPGPTGPNSWYGPDLYVFMCLDFQRCGKLYEEGENDVFVLYLHFPAVRSQRQ